MTPREIVQELDKHIVGQAPPSAPSPSRCATAGGACRSSESLRDEITPKNILMIGPTGVGKTEIARRLARLANAPFIKVEATKFTEVGYVGRDVDSIIRDLADVAVKMTARGGDGKGQATAPMDAAEERMLDALLPRTARRWASRETTQRYATRARARCSARCCAKASSTTARSRSSCARSPVGVEIMAPPGMEEMTQQLQSMFSNLANQRKRTVRKLKVKEALQAARAKKKPASSSTRRTSRRRRSRASSRTASCSSTKSTRSRKRGETHGRRRIARRRAARPAAAVEGCTVITKYGMVKTDHILFIASGAFHCPSRRT